MAAAHPSELVLEPITVLPRLRALAWHGEDLYASQGYNLMRITANHSPVQCHPVARFQPPWWRHLTVSSRLGSRLVRDGFHALAVLSSGHMVGAVPGAMVTLNPGESHFRISHPILRGTRPLHVTATPDDQIFWGEYFDNPDRDGVHIYRSRDRGGSWDVAYTFPRKAIRHVHNIVYDRWENCLWILTGDNGAECRIHKASCDLRSMDVVVAGNQQARAVALVPTRDGVYFSSDTPFEKNHVYFLNRSGHVTQVSDLNGSSIYGCSVGDNIFFSTMVEPSKVNRDCEVNVFGSPDGRAWNRVLGWTKDRWSPRFFQYGNAFLPDGQNTNGVLAVSTIAVSKNDLAMGLWRTQPRTVL